MVVFVSAGFDISGRQDQLNALAILRDEPFTLPQFVDQLVMSYTKLHPEEAQRIQEAIRGAQGYIDEAVHALLQEVGPSTKELLALSIPHAALGDWGARVYQLSAAFPFLRSLDLTHGQLEPGVLSHIGIAFEHLEDLVIDSNYSARWERHTNILVDDQAQQLQPFQNLRSISWSNSKALDRDLASMPLMPKLERLTLRGGDEHDNDFQEPILHIRACAPNLTHLDLGHSPNLRVAMLNGIEQLAHLTTLSIVGCTSISADELAAFKAQHPRLTVIHANPV